MGAWFNRDFENMVEGFRIVESERHYLVNFPDRLWIHNSGTYDMSLGSSETKLWEHFLFCLYLD